MQQLEHTITITVSGPAKTGKSTLIYLLADFLDHTGLTVDADLDTHELTSMHENFEVMLEATSVKSQIKIVEVTTK